MYIHTHIHVQNSYGTINLRCSVSYVYQLHLQHLMLVVKTTITFSCSFDNLGVIKKEVDIFSVLSWLQTA